MNRPGLTMVGTTYGLASPHPSGSPEQVYVLTVDDDPARPILVEGWCGYDIDSRLRLTRRQATELIGLLAQAVAK